MTKLTITITDKDAAAIAHELRVFLLRNAPAFVFDNCGAGTVEEPRRLTVDFPKLRREEKRGEIKQ